MKKTRHMNIRIPTALAARLDALTPRLRIRVKRDSSERDAYLTELIVLLTEHGASRMEAGQDVMVGTRSFAGAKQRSTRRGPVRALAPLTSARTYAELMRAPGIPTPAQQADLDADAVLLTEGAKVRVRGGVFHADYRLVSLEGQIQRAQRGARWPLVKLSMPVADRTIDLPATEKWYVKATKELHGICSFDLIPSALWDEHLAAVASLERGES